MSRPPCLLQDCKAADCSEHGFLTPRDRNWLVRQKQERVVLVNGCFDVLHEGHVQLLRYASLHGRLFVALNMDEDVARLKGNGRPVHHFEKRTADLLDTHYVEHVFGFDGVDQLISLIEYITPDILVKGSDYIGRDFAEKALDIPIFYYPHTGHSSTQIIAEFKK